MRSFVLALAACIVAAPVLAQEPVGCDKFKWPLDTERATLRGTDLPKVASGDHVVFKIPFATAVALIPFAAVKLPMPPQRAPKSPTSFAGFIIVPAPPHAGIYKITLSADGWIDVVQNGSGLKSVAFSGAKGCEGVRKSVKFDLAAAPFTVQISAAEANAIRMAISGASD